MPEHYTNATVSATAFCNRCNRRTMHRVDNRRKGPCLDCIARGDAEIIAKRAAPVKPKPAEQQRLF